MKVRETEEGAGPWCSKFSKVFWTKIAPRVVEWSSYFALRLASPSKSIFQFGQQRYAAQCRFGSGTCGIVYLVRLLPPEDVSSDAATTVLDTTTVGCFPEQQQRIINNSDSVGILRVVKLEEPDFPLEFYYMREARRRVVSAFRRGRIAIDVRPSICPALALAHSVGHFSCLLMPFYSVGLLNLLNYSLLRRKLVGSRRVKNGRAPHSSLNSRLRRSLSPSSPPSLLRHEEELVALYLSLELLWIAEGLHNHARIIHGDIKPDNFRINDRFPLLDVSVLDETVTTAGVVEDGVASNDFTSCLMSGRCTKVLVLLDFGLCIDMARFPPGTVFKVEKKRSFPCIEMLTGQPWTYQAGLAITTSPFQHFLVSLVVSSKMENREYIVFEERDILIVFGPAHRGSRIATAVVRSIFDAFCSYAYLSPSSTPSNTQLDLFNIAGVIYTLVFKRYMEVGCFNGEWRPKVLPRSNRVYRAIEIWRSIFFTLLNVRSCASADYPDLASLRAQCEAFLRDNAADYNVAAEKANAIIAYLSQGFNE
ncbi:Mitotic checkpoint serine/threonine-protein kinase BUB1 [Taenia solium]|eukprot:TsM_000776200 transcript=TsM_000776200 gene=TsM_000776200